MRIVKYVIYILLLLLIGGVILISTEKGTYVKAQKINLHAPTEMVYEQLRKWDNWKLWHARWTEDPTTSMHSEAGILEWASKIKMYQTGKAEFTKNIPFKTIEYAASIETSSGEMTQQNKINLLAIDDLDTEIYWESETTLSFWQKLVMKFGNADKYIDSETDLFLNSIEILEALLNKKMSEHHSQIEGIMELPSRNYLHTAATSNKANFIATARKKLKQLYEYTEQHGIQLIDSPEIYIHKLEEANPNILFSVALATTATDKLRIQDPEIVLGTFDTRRTLKTTLKGDYKYWGENLSLGAKYLEEQGLTYSLDYGILIKWTNYNDLPINPAEWLSEIYIPVFEPKPSAFDTAQIQSID